MTAGVCVAHLVRKVNDLTALREFVASWRAHPAGFPHELTIIYKGFGAPGETAPHEAFLDGVPHRAFHVDDTGYDIGSYLKLARSEPHDYFCFLNSFSRIEHDGWLEIMVRHALRPDVGLVGATGSSQSIESDFHDVAALHLRRPRPFYKRWILAGMLWCRYLYRVRGRFPSFPNPHLRTNAFVVARRMLLELRIPRLRQKWDAYRFESGERSLTRQVLDRGLKVLVAGADGCAYAPEEWLRSRTFWTMAQENLLVSDNQTRAYAEADDTERMRLSHHAWRRFPDGREGSYFPELPR